MADLLETRREQMFPKLTRAQIDRLEAVRSEISQTRTLMLFRMRRLLSAEQRAKMDEMHQKWERERKEQDRKKPGRTY